jgi:GTP-binding protein HflX
MDSQSAPTILVGVDLGLPNFDAELEELGLLAQTAGLQPVGRVVCKRRAPDAALFVGSGKAEEIRQQIELLDREEGAQREVVDAVWKAALAK